MKKATQTRTVTRLIPILGPLSALTLAACSTTVTLPEKPVLPEVPEYVKVPHPGGFDLAHLQAIFASPLAPKAVLGEFADTCDEEYKKLASATRVPEERKKGAAELVSQDPERMHWCFYAKIERLQETLQGDTTWSARQKKVLDAFEFLSPVANAFLDTYHDSRYLRWATQYYSKISEWVFFKKVTPTPESSLVLMHAARSDLEPWVPVDQNTVESNSVFAKYGISLQPSVASSGKSAIDPLRTNVEEKPTEQTIDQVAEQAPVQKAEDNRAPASVKPAQGPTPIIDDHVDELDQ